MSKIRKASRGEVYGGLTTLGEGEIRRQGKRTRRYEKCQCECGNIIFVPYTSLRNGHTKSCGCIRSITTPGKGTKFGRRTTLGEGEVRPVGAQGGNGRFEKCQCDCGTIRFVAYGLLKSGQSQSCGCYHSDRMKEIGGKNFKTHGLSKTRLYKIFRGVRARCNNPRTEKYLRYGGRGIKCERKNFEEFCADMQDSYNSHIKQYGEQQTTIERIDVNGNYCKENCRRATRREQANNTSQNRCVLYKGKKMTISNFAREIGEDYKGVYWQLTTHGEYLGATLII